jgi:4-amino-4-deoxy-L-arabinose transferase-like glycosyltransferase
LKFCGVTGLCGRPADATIFFLTRSHPTKLALAACVAFFLSGQAFIPRLGIEDDEALFAMPILQPRSGLWVKVGHSHFLFMLMSYLGTVKTWIYAPILRVFGTSVWAVREPALLAGAASIWLFYLLLRRTNGERAAVLGAWLLAVDSIYLLTTCFDWGPVALQHLLEIGAMAALVRFYQERREWFLALGFFLFGLAMWDKALAAWMLSGIGIGVLLVMPRRVLGLLTRRRIGIALLAFVGGALPLLLFNAQNHWETFRGNFKRDFSDLPGKSRMLMNTVGGQGLFGYMTSEDQDTPQPHPPGGAVQEIAELAGHPRYNLMIYAFLLAILLMTLARGDALRTMLVALIAMGLAWIQMAITAGAGGSVHHTVLLWPLPVAIVAVSFAAASRRLGRAGLPVLAAVALALIVSHLLVTNEYDFELLRNGAGSVSWTDAIYRLNDTVKTVPAKYVFCIDWGIIDSLRLLSHGKLRLREGSDPVNKQVLTAEDREEIAKRVADPDSVFIGRAKAAEVFPGVVEKTVRIAADAGYKQVMVATVGDGYGRPMFEIFRFVPAMSVEQTIGFCRLLPAIGQNRPQKPMACSTLTAGAACRPGAPRANASGLPGVSGNPDTAPPDRARHPC